MKTLDQVAFDAFTEAMAREGTRASSVPFATRVWRHVADAVARETRIRDAATMGERQRLAMRADLFEQEVRRRMAELQP